MKFYSDEIQHDDSQYTALASTQAASQQVSFEEEFDSVITLPLKPSTMTTKNIVEEQANVKSFAGSITKSIPVKATTNDGKGQPALPDTTLPGHNLIKGSSKAEVIRPILNSSM